MSELMQVDAPKVTNPKYKKVEPTAKQWEMIDYIVKNGLGEYDEETGRLNTDTAALKEVHELLNLKGDFETLATGKNFPNDRNCYAYCSEGDALQVFRQGEGVPEADTWKTSKNDRTYCFLNKADKKSGNDPTSIIVADARKTDIDFFSCDGLAYVQVKRKNKIENLMVKGEIYKRLLRCRYLNNHNKVPKAEWIKNAVEQISANTIEEGEEIRVDARIAHVDGKIYVDTADKEGNIIEIYEKQFVPGCPFNKDDLGYRIIKNAPVRFLRTEKMRPLPLPVTGGSIFDLKPFFNIEDEDFPLLIGAIIACFCPSGTYPTIPITGGDGRAKTFFAKLFLMLIDPSIVSGGSSPPKCEEDLILSARQRWIYFLDNLQELKHWLSDSLCRLNSGNASERRTLFSDSDTSVFQAKRPVLMTSITDVIKNNDLRSRSIPFDLPHVKEYKTEAELERDFNLARPKILGVIYSALSAALYNLPTTKLSEKTRLVDVCMWMQAAEIATGLEAGSILKAYLDTRTSSIDESLSSALAVGIIALTEDFTGTGKELAVKLGIDCKKDIEVQTMVDELRRLQTALESKNIFISFKRSDGKKKIQITRGAIVPEVPEVVDRGKMYREAK